MRCFILFSLLVFFGSCVAAEDDLAVSKLVLGQGYPFEEHEVVTEDGYILSLHRIPYGKNSQGKIGKPVIIQHGIFCSSACWVLGRPDQALGFIMADQGYDVWMPNNRGNSYSLKHAELDSSKSSDQKKYWDFSFHEMGYYDQPAIIDFILNQTDHEKLYYVGHSQGTTQFFVLLATRPEYNKKIIHMSAMSPIAYLDYTTGALRAFSFFSGALMKALNFVNIYNILPNSPLVQTFDQLFCTTVPLTDIICENMLFLITGFDYKNTNRTLLPLITKYTPAGASTKQFAHLNQLETNGQMFTQFNYGWYENIQRYYQTSPPEYNLFLVQTPITLHHSENDWIARPQDVEKLKSNLPHAETVLVPDSDFNHLDFMWAINASTLVYKPMIEKMQLY